MVKIRGTDELIRESIANLKIYVWKYFQIIGGCSRADGIVNRTIIAISPGIKQCLETVVTICENSGSVLTERP